jgi:hypothetical protein
MATLDELKERHPASNRLYALTNWYLASCNGIWEHSYGIKIDTLDNPGWAITIDLVGTSLEGRTFQPISFLDDESDWMVCQLIDEKFVSSCGPLLLELAISVFLNWASE